MNHPGGNFQFGPEQDTVLPPLKNGFTFLNLRVNLVMTNGPGDSGSRTFHDWLRENGADLAAMPASRPGAPETPVPFLLGYDLASLSAGTNHFNDISPVEIRYNSDLMTKEPEARSPLGKNPQTGQDTYYFRTRDDIWGVLQIIGFSDDTPPGVKIRYKLVQKSE
jgi:hypothetical protein